MAEIWDAERVVTPDSARRLIEEQFPELAPAKVEILGEGFDNTVYRVNERWVFRFPRRGVAVRLLETEARLLPEVAALGLPLDVPRPAFAGRPSEAFGWPFLGYEAVPGRTPGRLGARERGASASALGTFLQGLHGFPADRAKALGAPSDEISRLDVASRRERFAAQMMRIREQGLWREEALWQRYEREWLPRLAALDAPRPEEGVVLSHGDLHFRNLLADDAGKVTGVIDWGDLHVGHRGADLQIAYGFLPPESRPDFFAAYGAIDGRTELFARFRALYTAGVLLLYACDKGDAGLADAARDSLFNALS